MSIKLLQVSSFPAWPPDSGGAQRVHGLISGHRDGIDVTRFAIDIGGDPPDEPLTEIEDGYREYRYVPSSVDALPDVVNVQRLWLSPLLHVVKHPWLRAELETADVVQVEGPGPVPYVVRTVSENTTVVYSSHNVEFERIHAPPLVDQVVRRRIRQLERYAVDHADLVVAVSESDRERYREAFGEDGPFHVAYNGTSRSRLDPSETPTQEVGDCLPEDSGRFRCVFVGSNYRPNVRAVEAILDWAESNRFNRSEVEFVILGSVCDAIDDPIPAAVRPIGFVDDLDPWYAVCDLALNPVTTGAGSNTKIPEYFACRLPVLSTPFGTRGFPVENERHLLERPLSAFPETIETVEAGQIDTAPMVDCASSLVREELNWTTISDSLFDRYWQL